MAFPVLAEETPFAASQFSAPGYAAPHAPQSAPVPDEYFSGAVIVGDSMAEAFDLYGVLPEATVISEIGASARTAHDYAIFSYERRDWKLRDLLSELQPSAVYLWLGSNGVDTKPASQVVADYDRLLSQLMAALPDTLIYCIALPPVHARAQEKYANYTNARVDAFNEGLYELCAQHGAFFLDITDMFRHPSGELDIDYDAGDGIHLNRTACGMLGDYLRTHAIPYERTDPQ